MLSDDDAFPTLQPEEIALLRDFGVRESVNTGQYLFKAGDRTNDFFAVVSGTVEAVLDDGAGGERVVATHGPGRFVGELNLITGQRVFLSARVREGGEVMRVAPTALRRLLATHPQLGDRILNAFMARRSLLITGASTSLRLIGSRYAPATSSIREFLTRSRIPHEWLEPERSIQADRFIRHLGLSCADLPAVVADGTVLRHATPGVVAEYLGLTVARLPEQCFDLVIAGGGPAGLAAAVYGASEGLRTIAVELLALGGQAGTSSRIDNYLGFPTGVAGAELTQRAAVQAERFGARLASPCAATTLRENASHFVVELGDGTEIAGRAVIIGTGARYRRLDVRDLRRFEAAGVYYAATELEARACTPAPVVVVGGGNSAGQAAMYLAEAGSQVTVAIRNPDIGAGMSRYLADRLAAHPRIETRSNTVVTALHGDTALRAVSVEGSEGSDVLPCVGLFSFIGAEPCSDWLKGSAALDERGFVLTDRALTSPMLPERWNYVGRDPLPFETSQPGVFAVGDVRAGSTKRVAAAVGEGSAAVRSVHDFLRFTY